VSGCAVEESLFVFVLVCSAAELRSNHKLPYTDAFAAALATHRRASLATSDKDFATLEKKIDILWTTA
jgi:predicted nucleic acid-binding protein